MKIKVELIGLPELKKALGSKQRTVEVEGSTIGDLLEALERSYGPVVKNSLKDNKGNIQDVIQVIRNGREWLPRDNLNMELHEGDTLTFLLMVAGG